MVERQLRRNNPILSETSRQSTNLGGTLLELQRGTASRQATPVCDPKLSESKYSGELASRCT
jgi:hypothetical protein